CSKSSSIGCSGSLARRTRQTPECAIDIPISNDGVCCGSQNEDPSPKLPSPSSRAAGREGVISIDRLMRDEASLDRGGFDCLLQFLDRAHFDLAHTVARYGVLLRQILECRRVFP